MPKQNDARPNDARKNQLGLFTQTQVLDAVPPTSAESTLEDSNVSLREEEAREKQTLPPRPKSKRLDEAVQRHLGANTLVKVTDASTVLLSSSLKKGRVTARVHQMFLDASDDEMNAVGIFLKNANKGAGKVIDAYVEKKRHLLSSVPKDGNAEGRYHHLQPIFDVLKRRHFPELKMPVDIVWGGYSRTKAKRSITLGTFDSRAHRITIHPALDQERVPRTCVARVVHHEMCHFVHPAQVTTKGNRVVHTPAFKLEEAKYEDAEFADLWINKNLSALLLFDGNNEDSDD